MISGIVAFCCRRAFVIVALAIVLGLAAGAYVSQHFDISTNSEDLISPNVSWRKLEAVYDSKFPQQNNLTIVVVDGATPELTHAATTALEAKLAPQTDVFLSAHRATTSPFFDRNGLLFLSLDDVKETTQKMIDAQPFLGGLAVDPSVRGIMDSLSTALTGVERGDAALADLDKPMVAFSDTLSQVVDGQPTFMSWQTLVTGRSPTKEELRGFLEIQAKLDYGALSPGGHASDVIRQTAKDLGLTPGNGVRVRLTGPVPLADEEFATVTDHAGIMIAAMLITVFIALWLAVSSFRIILSIFATLALGLTVTMALGLMAVGVFNIISIAFIALFVGLGVDFGIQFSVRYRAERHLDSDIETALIRAGHYLALPLGLAAVTTSLGFFSFLPTSYVGVAQLGLIAGAGMLIAFAVSITVLPALIKLLRPGAEKAEVGFAFFAPLDRWLHRSRRLVIVVLSVIGVGSAFLATSIRFDSNPLDLRSAKTESVSTVLDLAKDIQTSPNTINVLAPSVAAAGTLADKLDRLPEVGQVISIQSFVPDDQEQKLALISDAQLLLETTLEPFAVKPPPSDAETIASLKDTAAALHKAANAETSQAANDASRLAGILDKLAAGSPDLRERATAALVPGLKALLDQLSLSLQAGPVTLGSLPESLKRDWVASDGTARIQVFPKAIGNDDATLKRFSSAVQSVAPNAIGGPVSILGSGSTIVNAFIEAGLAAFSAITILLLIVLRRLREVIVTLIAIAWAALVTLATCVLIGLQLNFANIIALPLFLGIGVAFSIYYLIAWRAGQGDPLQSPLTRAIIFSALTTGSAFGSLWLSSHPGTASMGELLMISLGWTLVAVLFFLNPLLGPVRRTKPHPR